MQRNLGFISSLVVLLMGLGAALTFAQDNGAFSFSLIGDLPYDDLQVMKFDRLIDDSLFFGFDKRSCKLHFRIGLAKNLSSNCHKQTN